MKMEDIQLFFISKYIIMSALIYLNI